MAVGRVGEAAGVGEVRSHPLDLGVFAADAVDLLQKPQRGFYMLDDVGDPDALEAAGLEGKTIARDIGQNIGIRPGVDVHSERARLFCLSAADIERTPMRFHPKPPAKPYFCVFIRVPGL